MKEDGVSHQGVDLNLDSAVLFSALAVYALLWIGRLAFSNRPSLFLLGISICYTLWIFRVPLTVFLSPNENEILGDWYRPVGTTICCVSIGCIFYVFIRSPLIETDRGCSPEDGARADETRPKALNRPLPVHQIIPSETAHTRLFPKKHSFKYSYLLVGVPLPARPRGHFEAPGSSGSQRLPLKNPSGAWFVARPQDHLERDGDCLSLREKLDNYLKYKGEDPEIYTFAYLVTAPTFLGYCFNPVSFWYLYDVNQILKCMILEVNNTFDERRMYLLKQDSNKEKSSMNGSVSGSFTDSWAKDFHVSPFNSRKGDYSLKADDILASATDGSVELSNVITLESSKKHAKLVASIRSTAPGVDARTLSQRQKARFLLSWWWVGFVTYPRIVKEAAKLYFKRKLHVWYRPEVLPTSIGRRAISCEVEVEPLFRKWLNHKVDAATVQKPIMYNPVTLGLDVQPVFGSRTVGSDCINEDLVSFKPTTPLFYSGLVTSSNEEQFLNSCLQCSDPLKLVLCTSRPETIQEVIFTQLNNQSTGWHLAQCLHLRWALIFLLRGFELNRLDEFALGLRSNEANAYRRGVLKLLVAKRLAFGLVEVINLFLTFVNLWALITSFGAVMSIITNLRRPSGSAQSNGILINLMFIPHLLWIIDVTT